jgi:hypothetical protein
VNPIQQADVLLLRPNRNRDRNRQHRQTNDDETGNREHKIPYETVEHIEMFSSQRESPLKPKQREKQASQQRIADVIHQGNFLHGPGAFRGDFIIGSSATATRECQFVRQ